MYTVYINSLRYSNAGTDSDMALHNGQNKTANLDIEERGTQQKLLKLSPSDEHEYFERFGRWTSVTNHAFIVNESSDEHMANIHF